MLLLSPSNTAYQVRTGLGLLTSMVACGPLIAKEVLMKLDFAHPSFESLTSRQSSSEIREGYIRYVNSSSLSRAQLTDLTHMLSKNTLRVSHFLILMFFLFRLFLAFLLHSDSASLMRIYMEKCRTKLAAIFPRIGHDSVHLIQVNMIVLICVKRPGLQVQICLPCVKFRDKYQ